MPRLKFYNRLRVGVRYFDMIASVENGTFYDAHGNDETGSHPFGATGTPLDDLITGMNRFTNDYPGEVVIGYITYVVDLSYTTDQYWDMAETNEFYDELQAVNTRCPANMPNDTCFDRLSIKTFLDANEGKGCVLLLTDGRRDPSHEDTAPNPASTMPTIIYTMQTLAIGLKFDMVIQNCHVSPSQNSLSKKPFGASSLEGTLKSKFDVFKGVVFANGTTLDQITPYFSIYGWHPLIIMLYFSRVCLYYEISQWHMTISLTCKI